MRTLPIFLAGLTFLLFSLMPTSAFSQSSTATLTFEYKTIHVVPGYLYNCKLQVYVDGEQVAESSVKSQEESNVVTVNMNPGYHKVRAIILVNYKGTWEEHLVANDYSIDCLWEKSTTFSKKKTRVRLVFDIDKGTIEK